MPEKTSVFVDGSQGTTGLKVHTRLSERDDLTFITLSGEERKDPKKRAEALNAADVAILCLPDDAARESVSFVKNPKTKILDASTAHRTDPAFAYGLPELSAKHRQGVATSSRIAVPGCHATGFIALVYPLIEAGVLDSSERLSCFSLTGYSGGGKNMIADYEDEARDESLSSPRVYGLSQQHKHLLEMQKTPSLACAPVFCPVVADFYAGMIVTVPLFASQFKGGVTPVQIRHLYEKKFAGSPIMQVLPYGAESDYYASNALAGKDSLEILVSGNNERVTLMARFDNLGKGACGAAIQCLNIAMGEDETKGLIL